ncbi:MAG: prolipoprotein diacylglyceryl transferase [Verrucomicrobia bacterium]|nr:prolipoprotein diacylglyceryl transferase [Verrucomicrobiota bacterium]
MFAYYVHSLSPFIVRFNERFGLHWYGFAYVLAFVVGYWVYHRLAQRGYGPLRPAQVGDFITLAAVCGVMLGGRLGWIIFYGWEKVSAHPLEALKLWEGGMSSHGGILGLFFFTLVYARIMRVSWPGVGDNLVVVAPIGLFFGRLANFVNGELWGRIVPGAAPAGPGPWWAMQFPKELVDGGATPELQTAAVTAAHAVDPQIFSVADAVAAAYADPRVRAALGNVLPPRYPSQLIEAALEGVVLFTVLWLIRTRLRTPAGVLTGVFFIGYAALRIVGEKFREPDFGIPFTLGLTRGQFLSTFMFLIGAGFIVYAYLRPRYFTPDSTSVAASSTR